MAPNFCASPRNLPKSMWKRWPEVFSMMLSLCLKMRITIKMNAEFLEISEKIREMVILQKISKMGELYTLQCETKNTINIKGIAS
jgi:hypothetical protein